MIIYGLKVYGPLKNFDGGQSLYFKKLFKNKEDLENYKSQFIEKCLNSDENSNLSLYDLERIDAVSIIEYEIDL